MQCPVKASIVVFLGLLSTVALGQRSNFTDAELNNSGANRIVFFFNTPSQIVTLAEEDINNKRPFLLLNSGLAPITYATDSAFEKHFKVSYWEQGCVGSSPACMTAYNQRIFQHLEEQYGRAWMKSVRKDVVGLREWRRKKNKP